MLNKTKLGVCVGSLALASAVYGSISFNIAAGTLRDGTGTPIHSGLIILAIDTNGDGFALPDASNFLQGDDMEVARWDFTEGGGIDGEFLAAKVIADYDEVNWTEGDPLALFWYPALDKTATQPEANAKFGVFADPSNSSTGDSWVMPADNTHLYSLQFFADGSILNTTSFASKYVAEASLEEGVSLGELGESNPLPAKASAISNTIDWDTSSAAQAYSIQRRKIGGDWEILGFVAGSESTYTDDELSPGVTYQYRVVAENGFALSESALNESDVQLFSERSFLKALAARSFVTPEGDGEVRAMHASWDLSRSKPLGDASDEKKRLLVQGTGPFYIPWGLSAITDTRVNLRRHLDPDNFFGGHNDIASNVNWGEWESGDMSINATHIDDAQAALAQLRQVNGFSVSSKDSAILDDFLPGYTYSAQLYSNDGTSGTAHLGVYSGEFEGGPARTVNRITSLSVRGYLGDGVNDKMFGYFAIEADPEGGSGGEDLYKEVLIRVEGPGLSRIGMPFGDFDDVLENPSLLLKYHPDVNDFFETVVELARNDDWEVQADADLNPSGYEDQLVAITDSTALSEIQVRVRDERDQWVQPFDPGSKDSLLFVKLKPGHYTFDVQGDTGISVFKIYEIEELPPSNI